MRTPLGTPSARIHDWHSTDGTASASDHYPTSNSGEEELTYSSEFLSSDERTQKQQYSVSGLRDVAGPTYEVDFTQAAQSRTRIRQGQMGTAYTVVETLVRRIDVQRGAMGPESGDYYPPQRQANPQPLCQQPLAPTQSQPKPIPGRYTEDGRGVLFYVRALYNYKATIPEEFDFQADDIIAVTATPEDGWWSGELVDKIRRVPGRHIFPSNFVISL